MIATSYCLETDQGFFYFLNKRRSREQKPQEYYSLWLCLKMFSFLGRAFRLVIEHNRWHHIAECCLLQREAKHLKSIGDKQMFIHQQFKIGKKKTYERCCLLWMRLPSAIFQR